MKLRQGVETDIKLLSSLFFVFGHVHH